MKKGGPLVLFLLRRRTSRGAIPLLLLVYPRVLVLVVLEACVFVCCVSGPVHNTAVCTATVYYPVLGPKTVK